MKNELNIGDYVLFDSTTFGNNQLGIVNDIWANNIGVQYHGVIWIRRCSEVQKISEDTAMLIMLER